MEKCKLEVGTKVVPHDKTVWGGLDQSYHWKRASDKSQPYLYVIRETYDFELIKALVLSVENGESGDYFNYADIELYASVLIKRILNHEKIAVHCSTEAEADKYLAYLDAKGVSWASGQVLTSRNRFDCYLENTCYDLSDDGLMYSPVRYYEGVYEIVEYSDLKDVIEMPKSLTPAELLEKFFNGDDTVIHCKTEDEADRLLEFLNTKGIKWCSGDSVLDCNHFNWYNKGTCYRADGHDLSFSDKTYYEKNFTVVEFSEIEDLIPQPLTPAELMDKFFNYEASILCKTIDEKNALFNFLSSKGYKWSSGDELSELSYFNPIHGTMYFASYGGITHLRGDDFTPKTVISFEGIKSELVIPFTKSNLKDGMWVETRNGNQYMVMGTKILRERGHLNLGNYTDNLLDNYNDVHDVMKVYSGTSTYRLQPNTGTLIWERKEN